MRRERRLLVAGAIAPPVGIVTTVLVTALILEPTGEAAQYPISSYSHALFFFMFFGLPASYLVELVLGVPLYHLLRAAGRLTLPWVACSGGIAGGALYAGALLLFFPVDRSEGLLVLFPLGAVGGIVSGAILWLVALRREA